MKEISTKEKILKAARKIFVEQGFAGASISMIAGLAEINHSLIFHHFENKEKLWLAVKQDIVQEANQQTVILPSTHLPFEKFLAELMNNSIHFYRKNPDIMRMINWQRLESNTKKEIGLTISKDMQNWLDAFKHYQHNNEINKKLKIEFIVTLVLSIVSSAALDPNIFIANEKNLKSYIKFCVQTLLNAFS
jgi:AcrR family transcriptional regulator